MQTINTLWKEKSNHFFDKLFHFIQDSVVHYFTVMNQFTILTQESYPLNFQPEPLIQIAKPKDQLTMSNQPIQWEKFDSHQGPCWNSLFKTEDQKYFNLVSYQISPHLTIVEADLTHHEPEFVHDILDFINLSESDIIRYNSSIFCTDQEDLDEMRTEFYKLRSWALGE
jgi:hypothetical protein